MKSLIYDKHKIRFVHTNNSKNQSFHASSKSRAIADSLRRPRPIKHAGKSIGPFLASCRLAEIGARVAANRFIRAARVACRTNFAALFSRFRRRRKSIKINPWTRFSGVCVGFVDGRSAPPCRVISHLWRFRPRSSCSAARLASFCPTRRFTRVSS